MNELRRALCAAQTRVVAQVDRGLPKGLAQIADAFAGGAH